MPRLVLVLFGLISGAGSLVYADKPAPLVVQLGAEPTQFDPLLLEDGVGLKLMANTLGTLFYYDGRGERKKGLIESYHLSKNKLVYQFKFKKNLKWSDGKPFHAKDFLNAIERIRAAKIKPVLSDFFPDFDVPGTKTLDSRTAQVALKKPDAQFLNWLTLSPFAPLREDMIKTIESTRSPVMPTLGAYEIKAYTREESAQLIKNPEYFDAGRVMIPEVKVLFISDENPLLSLFKSQKIDITTKVPSLQLEDFKKMGRVVDAPLEAVTYLAFNTKKPPFSIRENRLKVKNVLSRKKREELAKVLNTGELPAGSFLPAMLLPNHLVMPLQEVPKSNSEKLEFKIQSDLSSRNKTMLEWVQNELKNELGYRAALDLIDWKAHYAKLKTDVDEIYRFGWLNPVSDPFITYRVLASDSPNNYTGWANSKYDALVEELRQETRLVRKMKLIQQIENILSEECPAIPLLHQTSRFGVSKRVLGFRANPFGVILFSELRLAETGAN